MAGLRDLCGLRVFHSLLIGDLQRTAGLLAALRCVSTCVLRAQSANLEVFKSPRVTTVYTRRYFCTTEASKLDGEQGEGASSVERTIPRTKDELLNMRKQPYVEPRNARTLKVSILGAPNAGKSTLTNALMGWRVCSVSKKVHTTKHNTKALLVEGNTQILFVDTPGLVSASEKRRHNLEASMLNDPKASMYNADLVIVLVDASNQWTRNRLDHKVLRLLQECTRAVLVLNKIDLVKSKKILLDIVRDLTEGTVDGEITHIMKKPAKAKSLETIFKQTERALDEMEQSASSSEDAAQEELEAAQENDPKLQKLGPGWPHFSRIFMLSSLTEDGIEELKAYLFYQTKEGSWKFSPNFVTDQTPEEIAILAVREKLLDYLPKEIPYAIDLKIEFWEVDPHGVLRIFILVNCPEKHQVKLVIGTQGAIVGKVAAEARQMLMNTFRCEISLKLVVNHVSRKKK